MKILNKKIVCFGEALWDILPSGPVAGGAPMNVAIHLKNLGEDVELVSRIGSDKPGVDLMDFLSLNKISDEHIQTDTQLTTGYVNVEIDNDNNASYNIYFPSAWDNIQAESSLKKLREKAGIIVFGTLSSRNSTSNATLNTLIKTKALKVIDLNLREPYFNKELVEDLVNKSDIIKLNDEELETIGRWNNIKKPTIEWFALCYNKSFIIETLGKNGARIFFDGKVISHPGYKVNVKDTIGSGDAFLAGFIHCILEGRQIDDALDFACAMGSYVATKEGATPMVTVSEVTDFKKLTAPQIKNIS